MAEDAEATTTGRPCKGAALHLAKWMKSHPGSGPLEPEPEIWSAEQLRKRSRELRLVDVAHIVAAAKPPTTEKSPEDLERSPSRSTNSDSQITVRSSPVVPESVPVCRSCHKRCFSKPGSPHISSKSLSGDKISTTSPINNGLLHSNYVCQKKVIEEVKQCLNKCSKTICLPETKITNSPVRSIPESKSAPVVLEQTVERKSPSVSIRKSREEFFKTPPPNTSANPFDRMSKSPSLKSPSSQRSDSSRSTLFSTNSPLSYAHTTCSSMALSSNNSKKSQSPGRDSNASGSSGKEEGIQCVIAQEKYLNEVKCVENIMLSKNSGNRGKLKDMGKFCVNAAKMGGKNQCVGNGTNKQVASETNLYSSDTVNSSFASLEGDFFCGAVKTTVNGDVRRDDDSKDLSSDFNWGPLMLMGLSAINPANHLLQLDKEDSCRSCQIFPPFQATPAYPPYQAVPPYPPAAPSRAPSIAVVPPTPDYKAEFSNLTAQHTIEDSPDDSPLIEDPPYLALKRYGTMSSLERLPSDEKDDCQLTTSVDHHDREGDIAQGLLGWTARAGNYVAEKMAMLNSFAESGAASTGASFLERYLGAGEWKTVRVTGMGESETGEGSAASGEEAWGTPSSGDLSDQAFQDSDHATISSPTKSSSSCPGDEDTELMMDELLMTPPIAGPSLRPLLPRRRLEPLLEEEGSDSSSSSSAEVSSEVSTSPTKDQGRRVGAADARPAVSEAPPSPDRTPTNPVRGSPHRLSGSPVSDGASTSSTLSERPLAGRRASAPPGCAPVPPGCAPAPPGTPPEPCRLSPRMEMRLALQEGTDVLKQQEQLWDQLSAPCGWVRRPVALAARPRASLPHLAAHTTITSNSFASVQLGGVKVPTMERLALLEARQARRGGRRPRPAARIMGLVRRRASSDSPERRPYSPRRQLQHESQERQMDRRFWKQLRRRSAGPGGFPNVTT